MPGPLVMDPQSDAIGSRDLKKERSHAQPTSSLQDLPPTAPTSEPRKLNGGDAEPDNAPIDAPASGDLAPIARRVSIPARRDDASPPPLDRAWRDTPANVSFGKLLERLAQMCYFDLNELVTKMGEEAISQDEPETNGVRPHMGEDTNPASLNRKRMLLDFAGTWRERFIKALVISDWASHSGADVAKVIDLRATLKEIELKMDAAVQAVADVKREMVDFKVPAPNIDGALRYLGTANSDYPDLGYLKQTPLTARQILDLMQEMNVTANLRIWLNEPALPPHMKEYDIANGRATFRVPGEFEVDLACVDQEPEKSPWYFIDFRFLFSPASSLVAEQVRSHLEAQVNAATASKGLQGCYDLLHNVALDHKIIQIESQAQDMVRTHWFDVLTVERLRRIVVVQYWATRAGKRSWIEFAVHSGKAKGTHPSTRSATPFLGIRWFMDGTLVEGADLEVDWERISLEAILLHAIRKHSVHLLGDIQTRLHTLVGDSSVLKLGLTVSETNIYGTFLSLELPAARKHLKIWFGPHNGDWVVQPPTDRTDKVAAQLSSDPNMDTALALGYMVCGTLQDDVRHEARLLQWTFILDVIPLTQSNFKQMFPDAWDLTLFKPAPYWGDKWALAYTSSLRSVKWWTVRLFQSDQGRAVQDARELVTPPCSLGQMEMMGVAQVSYIVLSAQLQQRDILYHTERFLPSAPLTSIDTGSRIAVFVDYREAISGEASLAYRQSHAMSAKSWAHSLVRISPRCIPNLSNPGHQTVRHDVRLTVSLGKLEHLQPYLTKSNDQTVSINDSGGLALRLESAFGEPCLDQIRTRILGLFQLDRRIAVLNHKGFRCDTVSTGRLSFSYGPYFALSAHLFSSKNGISLKFEPPESNPHHRSRVFFEQLLNSGDNGAFESFAHTLQRTLDLLKTFEKLECASSKANAPSLHVRTTTWFSLRYAAPLPDIAFHVRDMPRMDGTFGMGWHVEPERDEAGVGHLEPALVSGLRDIWASPGPDCTGLNNGLVAGVDSVGPALERIDSLVRRFEGASAGTSYAGSDTSQTQTQQEPRPGQAVQSTEQPQTPTMDQMKQQPSPADQKKPQKVQKPDVITLD